MSLSDKAYARCKACNTRFYPRQIGDDFESMCDTCLGGEDEDMEFIAGYIQDKQLESSDE